MTSSSGVAISSGELSHIVLEYLSSEGFQRTFQQFEQEANGVLQSSGGHGRGATKSLRVMLGEYSALIEAEHRKQQFLETNPLAREMYSLLERQQNKHHQHHQHNTALETVAVARANTGMLASYSGGGVLSHQSTPDVPRLKGSGGPGPMYVYGRRQEPNHHHHHSSLQTSRNLFGNESMAALAAVSPRSRRRKGTPKKRQRKRNNAGASSSSLLNVNGNIENKKKQKELHLFAEDLAGHVNNKGDLLDLEKLIDETEWESFLPEFVQSMTGQPIPAQPIPAQAQAQKASLADALRDEDEDPENLLDNVQY